MAPRAMTHVLPRGGDSHTEERPRAREAETAVKHLQALGHLEPPEPGETRTRLPLTACRRDQPSRQLTSRLGAS